MSASPNELATRVSSGLEALGHPGKAKEMAAYMRTPDPFFGVGTPERRQLFRTLVRDHAPKSQEEYEAQVAARWAIPQKSIALT